MFSKMFKQKRIKLGRVVYYMFAGSLDISSMIHHFFNNLLHLHTVITQYYGKFNEFS